MGPGFVMLNDGGTVVAGFEIEENKSAYSWKLRQIL